MTALLSTWLSSPVAAIPSPSNGVWELGPLPLRGYALCIVLGIVVAVWIGEKRWTNRGGRPGEVIDVAVYAVIFGIIGARLYHVLTDWELYFGSGSPNQPIDALKIWNGGLGIWGGIALGAVGVWVACRTKGIRVLPMLDILAPGVLVAQAIGRWGNWFNQELYGRPTDLPWGLEIDLAHRVPGYENYATYHPTFLYECLWNLAAFTLLIWLGSKYKIGYGRMMALYVMAYTAGRGWIESMRIDTVQMSDVLGMRLNVWTSIVLFIGALGYFLWSLRAHPGREESIYQPGREPSAEELAELGGKPSALATQQAPAASTHEPADVSDSVEDDQSTP